MGHFYPKVREKGRSQVLWKGVVVLRSNTLSFFFSKKKLPAKTFIILDFIGPPAPQQWKKIKLPPQQNNRICILGTIHPSIYVISPQTSETWKAPMVYSIISSLGLWKGDVQLRSNTFSFFKKKKIHPNQNFHLGLVKFRLPPTPGVCGFATRVNSYLYICSPQSPLTFWLRDMKKYS